MSEELERMLGELPAELPVPPALDAAVLAAAVGSVPERRRGWPLAMAAGLVLGLGLGWWATGGGEPSRLELGPGVQVVEGHLVAVAGGVSIEVDGRVGIAVEPAAWAAREWEQEVEDMNPKLALAALGGAVVTVAVYEGSAWISGDGDRREVKAGDEVRVDLPQDKRVVATGVDRPDHADEVGQAAAPSRGDGARSELEQALRAKDLENAMLRGQLARVEGRALEWPEGLPAVLQPEGFRGWLDAELAGMEDVELLRVDCDEYPCVAVVRSFNEGDDWPEAFAGLHEGLDAQVDGEVHAMGMATEQATDGPDGPQSVRLYGLAVAQGEQDPDAETRIRRRADEALRDAGEELGMGEGGTRDEEVEVRR